MCARACTGQSAEGASTFPTCQPRAGPLQAGPARARPRRRAPRTGQHQGGCLGWAETGTRWSRGRAAPRHGREAPWLQKEGRREEPRHSDASCPLQGTVSAALPRARPLLRTGAHTGAAGGVQLHFPQGGDPFSGREPGGCVSHCSLSCSGTRGSTWEAHTQPTSPPSQGGGPQPLPAHSASTSPQKGPGGLPIRGLGLAPESLEDKGGGPGGRSQSWQRGSAPRPPLGCPALTNSPDPALAELGCLLCGAAPCGRPLDHNPSRITAVVYPDPGAGRKYVPGAVSPVQDLPGPGRVALASVAPRSQPLPQLPLLSLGSPSPSGVRTHPGRPAPIRPGPETQLGPQKCKPCGLDPGCPAGSQDKGWGWGLADPAYLAINIYQASGARVCSCLGAGSQSPSLMRVW